jgi:hypothetical protein
MTTNRKTIKRKTRRQITPEAVEIFRRMLAIEKRCTCALLAHGEEYWQYTECSACNEWWGQNSLLCREMQLMPWQWPAYEYPGSEGVGDDYPHAVGRYHSLMKALRREQQCVTNDQRHSSLHFLRNLGVRVCDRRYTEYRAMTNHARTN